MNTKMNSWKKTLSWSTDNLVLTDILLEAKDYLSTHNRASDYAIFEYNIKMHFAAVPIRVLQIYDDDEVEQVYIGLLTRYAERLIEEVQELWWVDEVWVAGSSGGWLQVRPVGARALQEAFDIFRREGADKLTTWLTTSENFIAGFNKILRGVVDLAEYVTQFKVQLREELTRSETWGVEPAHKTKSTKKSNLISLNWQVFDEGRKVVDSDGNVRFYNNEGKLHRVNGPAIEWVNGAKRWLINGKLHRLDGPAVEYADGRKLWYINDMFIGQSEDGFTNEEFENVKKYYIK